jgi:site-specific DNA-cytosine methylase
VVDGKMLDIRVRMFETHELARATSLDPYWFAGNKTEQKKQIGNAVPRRLATALCRSYLEDRAA